MNFIQLFNILICCLLIATVVSENLQSINNDVDGPSVLLIGLGPGGLSFLHALAHKRKQLRDAGDIEGLRSLPRVTAVERASVPGGIWRDHKNKGDDEYRNMYGDLWTNHPKETFEFGDYTFADHFGKEFPPFLRREHVLDYLLTRVTRLENVFETNEVYFRTEATKVRYSKRKGHFVATLNHWEEDESSGKTWTNSSTLYFDKVVWNGGWNGIPRYPEEVMATLDEGGYNGIRLHSLAVDSVPNDAIKDKNVVLIGDNDSANDIAYQLLKRDVSKVVIVSRSNMGSASLLPSWPENKVEILRLFRLTGVSEDGTGLVFSNNDFPPKGLEVRNVSAVIFCTGYDPNVDSLSPELAFALQHLWHQAGTLPVPSSYKTHELDSDSFSVPEDWRMPRNVLTDELAALYDGKEHIEPDLGKAYGSYISNKYVYRNVLMYNTNMFFNHEATYQQLFDIDVSAWLILGYITGEVSIPDLKTMQKRNQEDLIVQMENPNNRYHLDREYASLLDLLRENKEHWYSHGRDTRKRDLYRAEFEVQVRFLARDMQDAKYPASYGNFTHLNQNGINLVEMSTDFYHNKYWIGHREEDRGLHNPARGWTYRDMDCSTYISLYSGNASRPFSGHWLDVDNHGCLVDDSPDCGIPRVARSWDGAFLVRSPPPGLNVTDETDDEEHGFADLEVAEIANLAAMVVLVFSFITFGISVAFASESETKPKSSGKSRRFRSIDVLRGLCVFNMIFVHFGEYLSAQWFNQCSLFGTPTFLLVAGMSFHILSESATRKGQGVSWRAFRRAIFLYLLQAAQSLVLNGDINDIYSCETLMIAGHSQLILGMLYKLPAPVLGLLGVGTLAVTGHVRVRFMDIGEYWNLNDRGDTVSYDPLTQDLILEDILHFHAVDGVFPLFPYAAYPILGLAIGKLIYRPLDQSKSRSSHLKTLAIVGSMVLASGVALLLVGKLAPTLIDKSLLHGVYMGAWRSWPYETLEHVLVSTGRSLLYVVVATKMFDDDIAEGPQASLRKSIRDFFSVFGRFSLTLFSLHHVVIYAILAIGGFITEGQSYQAMFENMFELKTSLILGTAFLLLTHRLCLWLERESIPTLEHLQRRFCSFQLVSTRSKSDSGRYQSIDILRGLCVFNMVYIHFGEYLSVQWFNRYSLFGTPTFLVVAGTSFHILSESARRNGEGVTTRALKRAIFLYLLQASQSIILNGDLNDIYTCETLMMAGHAQVLLGMTYKLQAPVLGLLGLGILVATCYIRDLTMNPEEYWNLHVVDGRMIYDESTEDLDWQDIIPLHTVDGLFPLFPNAAYPLLGLAIGKLIYQPLDQIESKASHLNLLSIAGSIVLAAGVALAVVDVFAPSLVKESSLYGLYFGVWRAWPYETLEYSLVSVGRSLLYVVVATKIFDGDVAAESSQLSWRGPFRNVFTLFGRFSLTLFSLHLAAIYGILKTEAALENISNIYQNMLSLRVSLVLGTLFLLVTYRLCRWLETESIPSLEDLQRYFCNLNLVMTRSSSLSAPKFPRKAGSGRRFQSIDVLRGLCVFNMIFIHFGEYLSAQWFNRCSLFGTPTFLLVAGMSFHVLSESAQRKGEGVTLRAFKRAIFLYLLQGLQSLVLNGNISDIFACETLMMAGHSQILLGIMHKLQAPVLGLLAFGILAATGHIRDEFMNEEEYWSMHDGGDSVSFDPNADELDFTDWEDILHFHAVDGVFPLFPNAAYPILGLMIGKLIYQPVDQAKTRSTYLLLLSIAGSIALAFGIALVMVGKFAPVLMNQSSLYGVYIGDWRSWPYETLEHVLVSVGRSLLYIVVATKMFDGEVENDQASWRGSIRDFFSVFGRFSLTLFSLHHVVIYCILGIGGYITGQPYLAMFENMFEMKTSLILGSIFLFLTHRLCSWLERKSIPTLEHLQKVFCSYNISLSTDVGSSKKHD